ncbi:NAD(P)H-dependent oxidoreductase [Flavobacterium hydrophilum]|uniref:Flavodoxin family protein n=1 Tax=Flavobacterium hydrophilum TaxID=2211445 RepID=A0A2V4CMG2_9FLAO|nr:NAD(P)H-dependent oxidoreductase [Flavobacterium hydrophilum]PXY46894.1 flavodoxin family protein [Flavobacterium hydrophilum]
MKTNILLLLGHPSENSFCNALLDAYRKGVETTGANCKTLYISKLDFNVNLADGYKTEQTLPLEEDLIHSQELISWADHIVLAYPNWWGFMPAITKGFIDRIFMPGFAFRHHSGKIFPEKLLKGKSLRLLITMDTPKWWFYLIYRASQYQILKDIIFGYVGFDPIRFSTFGCMRKSTEKLRNKWLKKTEELGKQLK